MYKNTTAEKTREFNIPLYTAFVDLRKTYDSVNREAMWEVLERRYHVPSKILRIIRVLHDGTVGAVRADGKLSAEFEITTGVRQGDVLAPVLFNLYFDAFVAATMFKYPGAGVKLLHDLEGPLVGNRRKMKGEINVQDLEYADNMALVNNSMDTLEASGSTGI